MISWLEKLGLGLKKSSQKIGGGISGIFTKRKLDAETLEELEELLIASDMGVRTAAAIVGEFSKMRQDKEISEQEIREKNLVVCDPVSGSLRLRKAKNRL